jgi:chorismate mutase/prephenate dehydratase
MSIMLDPPARTPSALAALRAELDGLDDALHDVLMRRAEVVAEVAALAAKGPTPLRPGREAIILRRLLARHTGPLPAQSIPRIWRELIAGCTVIQRPILIAVCDPLPDAAFAAVAREHFGALAPLHVHRGADQVLAEVGAGIATAAVLPLPAEGEDPQLAWWTALLQPPGTGNAGLRMHVVARLPFWAPRAEGAPRAQALVVSAAAADPSGDDRTLLGLELPLEASRAQLATALSTAGFAASQVILRHDPGMPVAHALVDVAGFVSEADPRLATLGAVLHPPVILGAYAVPLESAA